MGGLLFKTGRLVAKDYFKYEKRIKRILKRNKIKFAIPKYFKNKEDFGDLDVLISKGIAIEDVLKWFKPTFWDKLFKRKCVVSDSFINGSVISINYNNFQIDFIRTPDDNWNIATEYYSYNDLGNLIGRISHKFNLKYGFNGLEYVYRDKDKVLGKITISKDIDKILTFLDLDTKVYHKGFTNLTEIFNFVCASKYFNPWIYDLEHLNKINRDRNKKRKTYQEWLKFIEPMKPDYPSSTLWFLEDKSSYINMIESWFPESQLNNKIIEFEALAILKDERQKKFNGHMVMNITGFKEGSQIGKVIAEYKNFVSQNSSWEDYLDLNSAGNIEKEFACFYQNIYK